MQFIEAPSVIRAAGSLPKTIAEYLGRRNAGGCALSVAHMIRPKGWQEFRRTPECDGYTVVLRGILRVETRVLGMEVRTGQAILVPKNESVRYSTPSEVGAEYLAVCLPACRPETLHQDE